MNNNNKLIILILIIGAIAFGYFLGMGNKSKMKQPDVAVSSMSLSLHQEGGRAKIPGAEHIHAIMGLLPNTISTAISEFLPKSSQNFLAYLTGRPRNLFNDFVLKF